MVSDFYNCLRGLGRGGPYPGIQKGTGGQRIISFRRFAARGHVEWSLHCKWHVNTAVYDILDAPIAPGDCP